MNPGKTKLKTPIQMLVERLEGAAKWTRTEDDRKVFSLLIEECKRSLGDERSHIENAWNDGQSGVKHQSGGQYFFNTYDIK